MAKKKELEIDRPLPSSLDAERSVLGSIVLDGQRFSEVAHLLVPDDFSTDAHRKIFRRMGEMHELTEPIDLSTLGEQLFRNQELESIGGLTYLMSLYDGLPKIIHIEAYAKIVKQKAVLRHTITRCEHVKNLCFDASSDPKEILSSAIEELTTLNDFGDAVKSANPGKVVADYPGGIEAFLRPERGIATGFPQLDDVLYGLQPECVYVIAADTSVGKSSLGMNIATNVAKQGNGVLVFALEMSKEMLVRRMVSAGARVKLHNIMTGMADMVDIESLKEAHQAIIDLPLYIDDDSYCSVTDIHEKIAQHIRQYGIKLVVIDQLQIMDYQTRRKGQPHFRDEREALTYITRHLHQYAKQFKIPIIEVSHLSRARTMRAAKDLRPKLRDLHGSSTIEKDADTVILLYREEMDNPNKPKVRGRAELAVAKNRNGRLGTIHMKFEGEFTSFEETEAPSPDPEN